MDEVRLMPVTCSAFINYLITQVITKNMINTETIKLYQQMEDMEQTKEIIQLKNQIKETLYQNLRMHFLELTSIGRVIGYDALQEELQKAIELLELQK